MIKHNVIWSKALIMPLTIWNCVCLISRIIISVKIGMFFQEITWVVGWCDGPGSASSAGVSYNLDDSRARAYCACSRCEWGLVGHIYSPLTPLSSYLWETARYRLKYCLKGSLNPKQRTNQEITSTTEFPGSNYLLPTI